MGCNLSCPQFHSCQILSLWCFAVWKVSKVTCCIKVLWEQHKETRLCVGSPNWAAMLAEWAWKVEKSWWLLIFLSERLLILERGNQNQSGLFSFAVSGSSRLHMLCITPLPYKHKRLQQKLLRGSADALDCLMLWAISDCRASQSSQIARDVWWCGSKVTCWTVLQPPSQTSHDRPPPCLCFGMTAWIWSASGHRTHTKKCIMKVCIVVPKQKTVLNTHLTR